MLPGLRPPRLRRGGCTVSIPTQKVCGRLGLVSFSAPPCVRHLPVSAGVRSGLSCRVSVFHFLPPYPPYALHLWSWQGDVGSAGFKYLPSPPPFLPLPPPSYNVALRPDRPYYRDGTTRPFPLLRQCCFTSSLQRAYRLLGTVPPPPYEDY